VGIVMFALLSRSMEPAAFGALAIIFNVMSFLAALAVCGQETLILRSWGEYCQTNRPSLARGALLFGAKISFSAASGMAIFVAITWLIWDRDASPSLVLAACAFLFAQSLMHFSGHFSRAAGGLFISDVPRELGWRLVVVATIAICYVARIPFAATEFFL